MSNLSEEEKKAIKRQKENIEIVSFDTIGNPNGEMYITIQDLKILLNLIEKLQEENRELKQDNNYQWEERCKLTFELERNEAEIQKQNKVIDLMAKERAEISDEIPVPAEAIKNYYFKKVEEENE